MPLTRSLHLVSADGNEPQNLGRSFASHLRTHSHVKTRCLNDQHHNDYYSNVGTRSHIFAHCSRQQPPSLCGTRTGTFCCSRQTARSPSKSSRWLAMSCTTQVRGGQPHVSILAVADDVQSSPKPMDLWAFRRSAASSPASPPDRTSRSRSIPGPRPL